MRRAQALLWVALCAPLAVAQEPPTDPAEAPESDAQPTYTVAPPPTRPRQRVAVRDRFEATLRLSKGAAPSRSGIEQTYEDVWLPPDMWNNQLDAQRTWRSAEDLAGKLRDDAVAGFELRWGLGPTGLYYNRKQPHELSDMFNAINNTERPPGGVRQGSLEMPQGVIPAIPVLVGQSWDVDPLALARWGRMGWGQVMLPQPAQGHLAKVEEGSAGPVLEVRWTGKMTLSAFHPPEANAAEITRPTTVRVDVKLSQPTTWEVDGDPYRLRIKSRATVSLPKGEAQRVDYDWTREVRRIE